MNQNRRKKQNCKFISFDIKGFCPAVAKELLSKCLNLVETKIQITEDDNDMFCLFGWFFFFLIAHILTTTNHLSAIIFLV